MPGECRLIADSVKNGMRSLLGELAVTMDADAGDCRTRRTVGPDGGVFSGLFEIS